MNTWTLEQIKHETSLEAEKTQRKLSCCGRITTRQGFLEKTRMLGNVEGSGRMLAGKPSMRWRDILKEARGRSPRELGRAV